VRTQHGAVLAIENRCPHRGGPLAEGIVSGNVLTCPMHGHRIDAVRGAVLAPDRGCVRRFPAVVEDGIVYVDPSGGSRTADPPPASGGRPGNAHLHLGRRRATAADFTVHDFDSDVPVLSVEPPSPDSAESLRLQLCGPRGEIARLSLIELAQRCPVLDLPTHLSCRMFDFTRAITWRGIRLVDLLDRYDTTSGTRFVSFYSWDTRETREGERFFETLPLEYATDPRTLLVFGMNGAPLPKKHGGPLRLVVPFLQGYKSVKWLTQIKLCTHDEVGYKKRAGFIESPAL